MTSRHSILIIDDNIDLAGLISEKLQAEQYEVQVAASAPEAHQLLGAREAPTFILADRRLAEPIEVRELARLARAAPRSKILVYTTADELTDEEQYKIREAGAYRILDKSAVDLLVGNIKVLTQVLDELLELTDELEKTTQSRSKIMAALVGSDVAVSVVDRHFWRWYHNSTQERLGGACRNQCWTAAFGQLGAPGTCWGCTISEVFASKAPVDGTLFSRCPDGTLRWVAVRSTPIIGTSTNSIIAAREAVTEVRGTVVAELPLEQRLHGISQSLIRAGFGRVRIYRAESDDVIRLVSAAARQDLPFSRHSNYFDTIRGLPIDVSKCPYTEQARREKGMFVSDWDERGASPYEKGHLELSPPYFDMPVWQDNGILYGWIAADFGGMLKALRKRAISRLATIEFLETLRNEYAGEVKRAFDTDRGNPGNWDKFEVARRARLGIANARSVDDATRELREAFGKLFQRCRVSVRMCTAGGLKEFESLCWGPRAQAIPPFISLQNRQSLSVLVAVSQMPLWLPNFPQYHQAALKKGEPAGYSPHGTISSAHIPLRFENAVLGTLSIDSMELIEWDQDGYKDPVLALARDTALVLRDLALDEEVEQAMADRAAIIAYSVSASGDALWRHWAHQRLAQASALIWTARGLVTPESDLDHLLTRITTEISRVHSARPAENAPQACSLSEAVSQMMHLYAGRHPHAAFPDPFGLPEVGLPCFILRQILMVLIDNAQQAIQSSGRGSAIRVSITLEDKAVLIAVIDDGPGIPLQKRNRILREPLEAGTGRGLGLLYARGAALQYGGDLMYRPLEDGTQFTLKLPLGGQTGSEYK